jgi:hypothetical protein
MFDLKWIKHILKGVNNITTPNIVEWITHAQKKQMTNEIQPLTSNINFSAEVRDYLWSLADYFNLKTYGRCKIVKQEINDVSIICN